jgi:DNA-binding NtrC family response regulator
VNKKVLIVEDQFVEANDLQLILRKAGYDVCGIARSVPIAQEMIKKENPGLVLLDIFLKGKLTGIDLARQLREDHIAFIYLSANSNEEILSLAKTTEPDGFIVKPFREKDLLVTLEIARYRHTHSREARHRREVELIREVEKIAAVDMNWTERLLDIGKILQPEIPFDYLAIGFDDPVKNAEGAISFLRVGFDEYQTIGIGELSTITDKKAGQYNKNEVPAPDYQTAIYFNREEFEKMLQHSPLKKLLAERFHLKSVLLFPLLPENGEKFTLQFYSRRPDTYNPEHITLLHRLQQALMKNIGQKQDAENTRINYRQQNRKDSSSTVGPSEVGVRGFEGIVGNSHLLLNVFDLITQVAPTNTTVLILGESGTGKEGVADCIHQLSPRKNKPFVKINCTTLPSALIESELFGHEKGSFTGAIDRRIGKFEKADKGTIFLDEIGEMSPDMQVKLLRVLQEKYIERIGATDITKVDVRIITATNRNLEKEVAEGRFRLDLYYRLNVFPIELPPLRERTEDIPALARHFIDYYNRKTGKKVTGLSEKVLKNLAAYHWPGNIRELENYIERSILLTKGNIIEESILLTKQSKVDSGIIQNTRAKTIFENERDYIIHILKKCNGRIWGAGGAAEILNIPPTTLRSKMKKLGIERERE